jgi:hypothetical protein
MIPDFLEMFYSSYKDNLSLRFEGQMDKFQYAVKTNRIK